MATSNNFKRSGRKWLNPEKSSDTGAVQWHVENEGYGYIEAAFSIWDCSKKIDLNFTVYSNDKYESARQRAIKVNMLIEELIKFREAMGKAYEIQAKIGDEKPEPYYVDDEE